MKKIALLPALLLAAGMIATPASADEGTALDPQVVDPGIAAVRGAFASFREARAADQACRGAQATELCEDARSEARATLETVRADAAVAHQQFTEKLQSWKDAKTPEEKAALIADLKEQAEVAKTIIEEHRDDISALRGKLGEELSKLDPKLRQQARRDALTIEKALREKNTSELSARLRAGAGQRGEHGSASGEQGSAKPKVAAPVESRALKPSGSPELRAPKPSGSPEIHAPKPSSSPTR